MPLGRYDYESRYRRRFWGTIVRLGFYLVTLGAAALFGYQIGVERTEGTAARLQTQLDEALAANAAFQEHTLAQEAAARAAQRQYQDLLAQYEREVPTGARRDLAALVARQLEAGVDPERLRFYIASAAAPNNCITPITRRLTLPTPAYRGANTTVSFADNRITVTGMGAAARTDNGQPAIWYDPAQEVTITFTVIGGQPSAVRGMLPLHHSVAVAGNEYRFTAVAAERGVVNLTADRCALP